MNFKQKALIFWENFDMIFTHFDPHLTNHITTGLRFFLNFYIKSKMNLNEDEIKDQSFDYKPKSKIFKRLEKWNS